MENLEFIAYEMARVSEENRSIRKEYYRIKHQYEQLQEEYDNFRQHVEQEKGKEKARKAKEPKEIKLFDVPHELEVGSKIVITDTSAKKTQFVKGFVLEIKSIVKNDAGIVTMKGRYAQWNEYWKKEYLYDTVISNKHYNWCPVQTDNVSLLILHGHRKPYTYERLIEE